MRIRIATALSLCSVLVAVGCGSTQAKDTAADEAKAASEAPKPWTALETPEEKGAFMKEVVVPTMGALLRQHDAEEFAEVNCKTCHGEDPKAVGFEMPTPDLPQLNPADNFAEHQAHDPEMLAFMMKEFTPKMAEVLGLELYNPETNQGFGCFACHTMKQAPAAMPTEGDAADTTEAPTDAQ